MFERFKSWYRNLPDKKRYIELLSAVLTIPVLITVILVNVNNLAPKDEKISSTTDRTASPVPTTGTPIISTDPSTSPTSIACVKTVGPVSIVYPQEDEEVQKDPVCIDINYTQGDYCSVVWSYRINGSNWSDYTDKSICLYNLSSGSKKLDLRVRSVSSNNEVVLLRNFTVPGSIPSATPIPPTLTPIPTFTPTPTEIPPTPTGP